MKAKSYWEHIHETKVPTQVSWYQEYARLSLQFMGLISTLHICLFV